MNTRLQASTVTQALKKMKERGLVKVVKAVNVKTKIVYMGTEFQPERELTGGAWYQDAEFDDQLVNGMRQHIEFFSLTDMGVMSAQQVYQEISQTGGVPADLHVEDYLQVIQTLVFSWKS